MEQNRCHTNGIGVQLFGELNGNQSHQQNTDNEDCRNRAENELRIGEQFAAHFRNKDRIVIFADGFLSAERVKQIKGEGQFPFDKNLLFGINVALLYLSGLGRTFDIPVEYRSEERRVGKECRSRWSPYH